MSNKVRLLQGNEACVEGALAAGLKFFGGYPITPSTEIAEGLAERLPMIGGKFVQMEDEIASMGAIIGRFPGWPQIHDSDKWARIFAQTRKHRLCGVVRDPMCCGKRPARRSLYRNADLTCGR